MTKTPRVFISYSWTTPKHQDWVVNLAESLVAHGVDVVIDKWALKEGHDKYTFMESMVTSTEIDKVLIILDKEYSDKANERSGGVGTETQIIGPKIYSNVSQEKFIPIVSEKNEAGNPFVPAYLEGRIYIDLSDQAKYEQNYESLLRNLFQRPAYNKPKLGSPPSYLFEDTLLVHRTTSILRGFDSQIEKNPKRVNTIIKDFLDEFFQNLKNYEIKFSARDEITIGKEICDSIHSYTPLRNDFISFFDKLIKAEISFDIETIIRILEKLPMLTLPQDNRGSWSDFEFDNFRFFIHELFLSLVAVAIKNENYKFVEELLYSSYFIQDNRNYKNETQTFEKFYHHTDIFNAYYRQTYSQNYISPIAELMIKRMPDNYTIDQFVEADLLCHYVSVLNKTHWFPLTYIYKTRGKFFIFDRIISARHFEKVKSLFNVSTPKELQDKLITLKENDKNPERMRHYNSFDSVQPLYKIINIDTIASVR